MTTDMANSTFAQRKVLGLNMIFGTILLCYTFGIIYRNYILSLQNKGLLWTDYSNSIIGRPIEVVKCVKITNLGYRIFSRYSPQDNV